MANILPFAALAVCGASILFALLALALPYWESYDINLGIIRASGHSGIFRVCSESDCADIIRDGMDSSIKSSYQATQAMVLLGFFALIGSTVSLVLVMFVMKGRKMIAYIAGALAIAGGFFLMVAMGIYADKLKASGADYGAGFAFDILGWLAAWAAGGLMIFITFTGGFDS